MKPRIYAIAGGPAAGKTSFRVNAVNKGIIPQDAFVHDCDAVMESLDGYQEQLKAEGSVNAFNSWELPARDLAEQQLHEHVSAKKDIIYDRSCALQSSYDFIHDLVINQGYDLVMYVLYVEPKVAFERAKMRETQTGRHIPEKLIKDRMKMISFFWHDYTSLALEAYVIDNMAPEHRIIAAHRNGQLIIEDPIMYSNFIANKK